MRPLRILMFPAFFAPHQGGVETAVFELSRRLVALGHEVTILTCHMEGTAPKETMRGVRVVRLPSKLMLQGTYVRPRFGQQTRQLVDQAMTCKPDLIQTFTRFNVTSVWGGRLARKFAIPYVHNEHGSSHSVLSNFGASLAARAFDHTFGARVVRQADAVVAVSYAAADFCRHLGAHDVEVIHNGVDPEFRPGPSNFRAKHSIDPDDVVTAFVGRLVHGKGPEDLLKAWRRTPRLGRLVIAGDGPLRAQLQTKAERDVLFLGAVDKSEVVELLRAANIFVMPSFTEGLPMSAVEAVSCGLPVIAYDIPAMEGLVTHGKTGALVRAGNVDALANEIQRLENSKSLRESLGHESRLSAAGRYEWETVTASYLELYRRLLRARLPVS